MGMSKNKSLGRDYVWEKYIEDMVLSRYLSLVTHVNVIERVWEMYYHAWKYANDLWQRIRQEFCNIFRRKMYFIILHAFSKWPDVVEMLSTTFQNTIKVLHSLFSRYWLTYKLVRDNGRQITSEEFQICIKQCIILRIKTAVTTPQLMAK